MQDNTKKLGKQAAVGAMKGLLGAVPFVGAALDEAFFEIRSRLKQDRVNNFIINFSEYLKSLNHTDIDIEQIKTEDFGDFFEEIILKVSRTSSELKIKAFRNLLTNQILNPQDIEKVDILLSIISQLKESQFIILNNLVNNIYSQYGGSLGEKRLLERKLRELQRSSDDLKAEWRKHSDPDFNDKLEEVELEIEKLKEEIEEMKEEIEKYSAPFEAKSYGLNGSDFFYLIQDLSSKGLIVDRSGIYAAEPFEIIEATQLGMDLLEFIKGK